MRRRGVVPTVLAVATVCLTSTVRALGEADLFSYNDAYLQADMVETAPSASEPPFADTPPVITSSALGPAAGCRMVLVSTLDGRISALDTAAGGALLWSLQASEAGMLRSTLTQNLQLSQLGQWVRLIPSLDGRLFSYDGDQVDALPITAETLLQSSFRFADDTVIMGGSEVVTLGIDLRTGRIRYKCGTNGCVRNSGLGGSEEGGPDEDDGDVLVLRQHTQTVRAVEPRSGQERWNFSVSRHELAMSAGERTSSQPDPPPVDSLLTAALSEGRLSGVERGRRWQHQFHGPLVHVWRLDGGQLHEVDLLSPAASGDDPGAVRPLLYLGVHQHQLYIQQSRAAADGVMADSRLVVSPDARAPPVVKWRPYMVSANSRTPVIYGTTKRHQNPLLLGDSAAGTALALRPEEYPYEGGYYLYSSDCVLPGQETHGPFPNPQLPAGEHPNLDSDDSVVYVVITSLSYWWPQIMLMSVSIAVILNLLVTEHYRLYYRAKALRAVRTVLRLRPPRLVVREVAVPVREEVIREVVKEVVRDAPPSTPPAPQSRFLEDFEPIQCLGKGGFGVVFEARNKLDGQSYAVKRIRLPNRERARRKVLREVSCLAKLDHRNIVRYSHCWTEKLSPACLEQQDSVLDTSEWVSSRTPLNSLDSGGVVSAPPSPEDEVSGSVLRMTQFASALPGEAGEEDWRLRTLGGGFLPALGETEDASRSRSGAAEDSIVFSRTTSVDTSGTFSLLDGHELATQQGRTGFSRRQRRSGESVNSSAGAASPRQRLSSDSRVPSSAASSPRQRPSSDSRVPSSGGDDDDSVVFAAESGAPVVDYTLPDSEGSTGSGSGTSAGPVVAFQTKQGGLTDGSSMWEDDGAGESDSEAVYLFIQMQLCRKESLKDWLSANCGPRSAPRVLAIFRQILNGVEYVHAQRLMHRDLKPSNIFFSLDGIVKIGDFGLATTMGSEPTHHTPACAHNCADSRHTNHVGTQLYMSPEQVLGHPYDAKVDIYSLGIILFELLVPFSTQMERQRVLTLVRRLVFPEPFQRGQPDEHSLLTQMLCHQPARRPPIAEIRRSVSRCRAQSRGGALLEDDLDGKSAAKAVPPNGGEETPAGKDASMGFNVASSSDAAGLGLDLSVREDSGEDSDGWEASGLNSTVLNSPGMIFVGPDQSEPDSTGLVFTGLISPESRPGSSPASEAPLSAASEASLSDPSPAREAAADAGEPVVDSVVPTRPLSSRLYLAGLEASGRDSDESSGED